MITPVEDWWILVAVGKLAILIVKNILIYAFLGYLTQLGREHGTIEK